MTDPYEDAKVKVTLTELGDISFADKFACGDAFVIGRGHKIKQVQQSVRTMDLSCIESLGHVED